MPIYSDNLNDTITTAETISALDAFLRDTITMTSDTTIEFGNSLSDTITVNETLLKVFQQLTAYLNDYIFTVDDVSSEWTRIGSFTEDSQTDHTWTEI